MPQLDSSMLYLLADKSNDPIDGSADFTVCGSSAAHLGASIAMLMPRLRAASHVKTEKSALIFSNGIDAKGEGWTALPFPLDVVGVVQMVENFFRQLDPNNRPSYPDHDGSNSPGWRVARDGYWGNLKVSFCWMEHHK